MSDLIERLERATKAVYVATDEAVAASISDLIREAAAALRAQQPQPIATAPRDGRPFLVGRCFLGTWHWQQACWWEEERIFLFGTAGGFMPDDLPNALWAETPHPSAGDMT